MNEQIHLACSIALSTLSYHKRRTEEAYLPHLFRVCGTLYRLGYNDDALCVAMLQNCLESDFARMSAKHLVDRGLKPSIAHAVEQINRIHEGDADLIRHIQRLIEQGNSLVLSIRALSLADQLVNEHEGSTESDEAKRKLLALTLIYPHLEGQKAAGRVRSLLEQFENLSAAHRG